MLWPLVTWSMLLGPTESLFGITEIMLYWLLVVEANPQGIRLGEMLVLTDIYSLIGQMEIVPYLQQRLSLCFCIETYQSAKLILRPAIKLCAMDVLVVSDGQDASYPKACSILSLASTMQSLGSRGGPTIERTPELHVCIVLETPNRQGWICRQDSIQLFHSFQINDKMYRRDCKVSQPLPLHQVVREEWEYVARLEQPCMHGITHWRCDRVTMLQRCTRNLTRGPLGTIA